MPPASMLGGGTAAASLSPAGSTRPIGVHSGHQFTFLGISPGNARTSWREATLSINSGRMIRATTVFMASIERMSISSGIIPFCMMVPVRSLTSMVTVAW